MKNLVSNKSKWNFEGDKVTVKTSTQFGTSDTNFGKYDKKKPQPNQAPVNNNL